MAANKTPLEILNEIKVRQVKETTIAPTKDGRTFHAVERADTFGSAKSIEGYILVENTDGTFHRLTGKELSELNETNPEFLKHWKLPNRE